MISSLQSALTVDVEDAVNQAMRNFFGTEMEPTYRVYDNTMRLLDLFDEYNSKATFFILGEVAKTYPELIKEISKRNHELGIHGYTHITYDKLSREQVKAEIVEAKKLVEDISGVQVLGHRAPAFSISRETFWVMEVLAEAGIQYDSSLFPATTNRYGWSGFNKDIDWIKLDNGMKIIEAPMSSLKVLNKEIPVCGGGYFRAFPYFFTRFAFSKVLSTRPVNVYLHPYEIDSPPYQQFYMDEVSQSSFKNRMKLRGYWFNRKTVVPKLRNLLDTFHFDTMRSVINIQLKTKI